MTTERYRALQFLDGLCIPPLGQANRALQPIGAIEIRLDLDHLDGLVQRSVRTTCREVCPADVHIDERRERIDFERAPSPVECFAGPSFEGEKQGVV